MSTLNVSDIVNLVRVAFLKIPSCLLYVNPDVKGVGICYKLSKRIKTHGLDSCTCI